MTLAKKGKWFVTGADSFVGNIVFLRDKDGNTKRYAADFMPDSEAYTELQALLEAARLTISGMDDAGKVVAGERDEYKRRLHHMKLACDAECGRTRAVIVERDEAVALLEEMLERPSVEELSGGRGTECIVCGTDYSLSRSVLHDGDCINPNCATVQARALLKRIGEGGGS